MRRWWGGETSVTISAESPIQDLGLSTRSKNVLRREGIATVGQLIRYSDRELLKIRGIRSGGLQDIRAKLEEHGFVLGTTGQITEDSRIEDLGLTVRTENALRNARITTVGQLIRYSDRELLKIRGIRSGGLQDIRAKLEEHGFVLGTTGQITEDSAIEDLGLLTRTHTALHNARIRTVWQLTSRREAGSLWKVKNLGEKGLEDIDARLAEHGFISGSTSDAAMTAEVTVVSKAQEGIFTPLPGAAIIIFIDDQEEVLDRHERNIVPFLKDGEGSYQLVFIHDVDRLERFNNAMTSITGADALDQLKLVVADYAFGPDEMPLGRSIISMMKRLNGDETEARIKTILVSGIKREDIGQDGFMVKPDDEGGYHLLYRMMKRFLNSSEENELFETIFKMDDTDLLSALHLYFSARGVVGDDQLRFEKEMISQQEVLRLFQVRTFEDLESLLSPRDVQAVIFQRDQELRGFISPIQILPTELLTGGLWKVYVFKRAISRQLKRLTSWEVDLFDLIREIVYLLEDIGYDVSSVEERRMHRYEAEINVPRSVFQERPIQEETIDRQREGIVELLSRSNGVDGFRENLVLSRAIGKLPNADAAMVGGLESIYREAGDDLLDTGRDVPMIMEEYIDRISLQISQTPPAVLQREKTKGRRNAVMISGNTVIYDTSLSGLASSVSLVRWMPGRPAIKELIDLDDPTNFLLIVSRGEYLHFWESKGRTWSKVPAPQKAGKVLTINELKKNVPEYTRFADQTLVGYFGKASSRTKSIEEAPQRRSYNAGNVAFGQTTFQMPRLANKVWQFLPEHLERVSTAVRGKRFYDVFVDQSDSENYLFFLSTPLRVVLFDSTGILVSYPHPTESEPKQQISIRQSIFIQTFFHDLLRKYGEWEEIFLGTLLQEETGQEPNGVLSIGGPGSDEREGMSLNFYRQLPLRVESPPRVAILGWSPTAVVKDRNFSELTTAYRIASSQLIMTGVGNLSDPEVPVYVLYGNYFNVENIARIFGDENPGIINRGFRENFGDLDTIRVFPSYSKKRYRLVETDRFIPVKFNGQWFMRKANYIVEADSDWEAKALEGNIPALDVGNIALGEQVRFEVPIDQGEFRDTEYQGMLDARIRGMLANPTNPEMNVVRLLVEHVVFSRLDGVQPLASQYLDALGLTPGPTPGVVRSNRSRARDVEMLAANHDRLLRESVEVEGDDVIHVLRRLRPRLYLVLESETSNIPAVRSRAEEMIVDSSPSDAAMVAENVPHPEEADIVWNSLVSYLEENPSATLAKIQSDGHAQQVASDLEFTPGDLFRNPNGYPISTTVGINLRTRAARSAASEMRLTALAFKVADHVDELAVSMRDKDSSASELRPLDKSFQRLGEDLTWSIGQGDFFLTDIVREASMARNAVKKMLKGKGVKDLISLLRVANFRRSSLNRLFGGEARQDDFLYETDRQRLGEIIGYRIAKARRRLGLSKTEFAEEVGAATYGTIRQYERGEKIPSVNALYRIIEFLGTDWDEFLKSARGQGIRQEIVLNEVELVSFPEHWRELSARTDLEMLGGRLEELREERGLSRTQVEEIIGMSLGYLIEIERGDKEVNIDIPLKLIRLYRSSALFLNSGKMPEEEVHYLDPVDFRARMASRLTRVREEYGLPKGLLSQIVGDPRGAYIGRIEAGNRIPSFHKLILIAKALRFPPDAFLAEDKDFEKYFTQYQNEIQKFLNIPVPPQDQWKYLPRTVDEIGWFLRELRIERKYSIAEVAREAGITPAVLERVEAGGEKRAFFHLRILIQLADFYGVPVFTLLTRRPALREAARRRDIPYHWPTVRHYLWANIEEQMELHGIRAINLAARIGLTRQAVSLWKTQGSGPDAFSFARLVEIFQISPDELLEAARIEIANALEEVYGERLDLVEEHDIAENWLADRMTWEEIGAERRISGGDLDELRAKIIKRLQVAELMQEDGSLTPWRVLGGEDESFGDPEFDITGFELGSYQLEDARVRLDRLNRAMLADQVRLLRVMVQSFIPESMHQDLNNALLGVILERLVFLFRQERMRVPAGILEGLLREGVLDEDWEALKEGEAAGEDGPDFESPPEEWGSGEIDLLDGPDFAMVGAVNLSTEIIDEIAVLADRTIEESDETEGFIFETDQGQKIFRRSPTDAEEYSFSEMSGRLERWARTENVALDSLKITAHFHTHRTKDGEIYTDGGYPESWAVSPSQQDFFHWEINFRNLSDSSSFTEKAFADRDFKTGFSAALLLTLNNLQGYDLSQAAEIPMLIAANIEGQHAIGAHRYLRTLEAQDLIDIMIPAINRNDRDKMIELGLIGLFDVIAGRAPEGSQPDGVTEDRSNADPAMAGAENAVANETWTAPPVFSETEITSVPGGIDFNSEILKLNVAGDAKAFQFPGTEAPMTQTDINGFMPVIINITPVTNFYLLLGLSVEGTPQLSALKQ